MAQWTKLTTDSAIELAQKTGLSDSAKAFLAADMRPEVYLELLQEQALWTDAIALMAAALPIVEAIGWACACDRSTINAEEDDPRHQALLAAVERFVDEPGDDNRTAVLDLLQDEPDESAGEMLAAAASFSDGKVQIGDDPPIPVPTDSIPAMIAGAVTIVATRVEPDELDGTYQSFLQRAVAIASGDRDSLPDANA